MSYTSGLTSSQLSAITTAKYNVLSGALPTYAINANTATSINATVWSSSSFQSSYKISANYSEITADSFKIKNIDVGRTLEEISSRLAIIMPDIKKLEKYAALKRAYDNYKMIEALCNDTCSP